MNIKRWIVDNLDAEELPTWAAANTTKFTIEVLLAAVTILPFYVVVYVIIWLQEFSLPFGVAGPLGLYLLLVAGGYKEFWNCRLKD